jgi:hypothetical protein
MKPRSQNQMRLALEANPLWDRLPGETKRCCIELLSQLLEAALQGDRGQREEDHEREGHSQSP